MSSKCGSTPRFVCCPHPRLWKYQRMSGPLAPIPVPSRLFLWKATARCKMEAACDGPQDCSRSRPNPPQLNQELHSSQAGRSIKLCNYHGCSPESLLKLSTKQQPWLYLSRDEHCSLQMKGSKIGGKRPLDLLKDTSQNGRMVSW